MMAHTRIIATSAALSKTSVNEGVSVPFCASLSMRARAGTCRRPTRTSASKNTTSAAKMRNRHPARMPLAPRKTVRRMEGVGGVGVDSTGPGSDSIVDCLSALNTQKRYAEMIRRNSFLCSVTRPVAERKPGGFASIAFGFFHDAVHRFVHFLLDLFVG